MSAALAHHRLAPEWRQRLISDSHSVEGCWLWRKHVDKSGYARTTYAKDYEQLAHRLSYRLFKGEIPDGLTIDHLCRRRYCINPDHLDAVTQRENVLRGEGVAARRARQTHCKRGHEFSRENTYIFRNGRRGCRSCAKSARRRRYLETGT